MPALWDGAHGCQPPSLPWSQASQASRGSLQAPESQGGLSLLPDLVAQQAPWSHSCQARQACQLFPSLLPGPSVLKVPDHPARTGNHIQHGQVLSSPLSDVAAIGLSLHPPSRSLESSSACGHSILTSCPPHCPQSGPLKRQCHAVTSCLEILMAPSHPQDKT